MSALKAAWDQGTRKHRAQCFSFLEGGTPKKQREARVYLQCKVTRGALTEQQVALKLMASVPQDHKCRLLARVARANSASRRKLEGRFACSAFWERSQLLTSHFGPALSLNSKMPASKLQFILST